MNGSEAAAAVPCFIMLILIVLGVTFSITVVVTWVWALIHAATHQMDNQAVWLLVIILGGPIGAVAYFIAKPYKGAPDSG